MVTAVGGKIIHYHFDSKQKTAKPIPDVNSKSYYQTYTAKPITDIIERHFVSVRNTDLYVKVERSGIGTKLNVTISHV